MAVIVLKPKKSKDSDKTASTPLVTVTDLEKMKKNEIIVNNYFIFFSIKIRK